MDIVKAGLSALTGASSGQTAMLSAVMGLLGGGGGLGGLLKAFQGNGLGDIASSWIGKGANLPVSPDQLTKALGAAQISQFASQAGIAPEAAGSTLASILPGLVDKLTPDGQLPASNELPGLDVLKKLIGS